MGRKRFRIKFYGNYLGSVKRRGFRPSNASDIGRWGEEIVNQYLNTTYGGGHVWHNRDKESFKPYNFTNMGFNSDAKVIRPWNSTVVVSPEELAQNRYFYGVVPKNNSNELYDIYSMDSPGNMFDRVYDPNLDDDGAAGVF